jgi:probable rRNA maturation factor
VATDVLSFPEEDGRKSDPVEGDIAISLEALRRNAAEFGVPENEEMKRLLVHGLLHLAGMNHGRGRGGVMLALQEKLLDTLRLERIYGEKRT